MKLRKYIFFNDTVLLATGLTAFVFAGILNTKLERPVLTLSKQETAINIDKNLLLFLNAGNKRLLTDLLWVQTLIESDVERYKKKDLNSWLFLRFNSIATLDPNFYQNYLYGGQFLSIIKDDLEGADVIYDKGLSVYPDDYALNFNAGFLNYYEIGNFEKGITYLSKIENHKNAPIYVRSIINKLLVATGTSLDAIFELVKHNYETTQDKHLKEKLGKDLYAIRAEIDLECLNENKKDCRTTDLEGIPYVFSEGKYSSRKNFNPYRIKVRDTKNEGR